MNIVILGYGGHGKDTIGALIEKHSELKCTTSSQIALDIFLFEILSQKYGYKTIDEAYQNRYKDRKDWYTAIQDFNKNDKTRLAKEIMKMGDIYIGMRDIEELTNCMEENVFDLALGIFDPRKPIENHSDGIIDPRIDSDYLITNNSSLEQLEKEVIRFLSTFNLLKK